MNASVSNCVIFVKVSRCLGSRSMTGATGGASRQDGCRIVAMNPRFPTKKVSRMCDHAGMGK